MTPLSDLPAFGGPPDPRPGERPPDSAPPSGTGSPARAVERDTIVVANPALRGGFVQLPRTILHARGLSRDAKLLYAVLLSYAWQKDSCFPGYERLKADLGCGINQITRYMRELEHARLISRRKRGQGKTTVYTLHDLPDPVAPSVTGVTHQIGESKSATALTHQISEAGPTKPVSPQPPKRRLEQDSAEREKEEQQQPPWSARSTGGGADTEAPDVVALLVANGVTPRTAHALADAHGGDRIRQQIEWHGYRDAMKKNPAGALVQAIRDNWAPPPAWAAAKEREAAQAHRETDQLLRPAASSADHVSESPGQSIAQDESAAGEPVLSGVWAELANALRSRLSGATYAAFIAPVLRTAPELPSDTRALTLVLPTTFALEKWHRPPIKEALAEATAALGIEISLQEETVAVPASPAPVQSSNTTAR